MFHRTAPQASFLDRSKELSFPFECVSFKFLFVSAFLEPENLLRNKDDTNSIAANEFLFPFLTDAWVLGQNLWMRVFMNNRTG